MTRRRGPISSCNVVSGTFVKFSAPFDGDDISDVIIRCRDELPFSDQLPAFDPPTHTAHRHLLLRLITPKRLKENEDFMWQYANHLIDGFVTEGSTEMVGAYAEPFTLTVIADLEGVPAADHSLFRHRLSTAHEDVGHKPLEFLYERFSGYIEDRRQAPRNDVLSGLATATFPDGSTPEVKDAALLAANVFAGGQETTVRLLSFALRMLGERPDLQQLVREDRARIPNFIEETLRVESPLRTQFRLARVRSQLGGVDIPAGSTIMLVPGACNRDPRVFAHPHDFDIDRANRASTHCVRPRDPHLRRSTTRSSRGPGDDQPVPRSHDGHHHLGHTPRSAWRATVRVPPYLFPEGAPAPVSRVRPRRLTRRGLAASARHDDAVGVSSCGLAVDMMSFVCA